MFAAFWLTESMIITSNLGKEYKNVDFPRFCRHISISSSKFLEVHRAQLIEMAAPENAMAETLNVVKHD